MKTIKKFFRFVSAFFRSIFKFIDKTIVVPITKLILLITEKTGKKPGKLEGWLVKKNTLVFISLILAIGLFFLVDSKSLILADASAEVLYDQKVESIYNSEDYVVEGLPETVDVTLIGRKVDLYLAKQLSSTSISVDLSELGEGTHKDVKLNYETAVNSVKYKLDPSTVNINIYPKVSENRKATIDIINLNKLDKKLSISDVTIDQTKIVIKGAEHTLEKVATVKALIDVSKLTSKEIGIQELEDVSLVAYDGSGNKVDVEMVPSKVNAKVSIISPKKEIPIKIVPKGEVLFGKAISSMVSDVTKVTVYASEDVLDTLEYVPVVIDVKNLDKNKDYNVKIKKPDGVNELSVDKIKVTITLGNEESKEINDIYIETINLDPSFKVLAIGENSNKTTVIVKGTKEVLDLIDSTSLKAVIDLSDCTKEGDYEVPVEVEGNDSKATYTSKTSKVKIRISLK